MFRNQFWQLAGFLGSESVRWEGGHPIAQQSSPIFFPLLRIYQSQIGFLLSRGERDWSFRKKRSGILHEYYYSVFLRWALLPDGASLARLGDVIMFFSIIVCSMAGCFFLFFFSSFSSLSPLLPILPASRHRLCKISSTLILLLLLLLSFSPPSFHLLSSGCRKQTF